MGDLSAKPNLIAVTGAGGLVGSYLVQYLWKKGYSVVAIVRTPGKPRHFAEWLKQVQSGATGGQPTATDGQPTATTGQQVLLRLADVTDQEAISQALSGCDLVVHAAGEVNPYGERQRIFQTNVQGTKNVFECARRLGLRQFIHVSSLSVITGQGDQYAVDESAPLRYCGENYADSKTAAEEALRGYNQEAQKADREATTQLTILRPGFIYGPGEKTWMPRLIESIRTGKAALIDGGTKETNVINVENLCRAIERSFFNEKAYGRTFNLTDGEKVTKKMLFDAIADGLSLNRVSKKIPSSVARPFCQLVSSIAPMLPVETQQKLARYSRAAFRLAGVNQGFSIKKAESELGYLDRVPFAEGMALTLKQFAQSSAQDTRGGADLPAAGSSTGSSTGPGTGPSTGNDRQRAQAGKSN